MSSKGILSGLGVKFPGHVLLAVLIVILVSTCCAFAQETTAGLQGTVKDSSGAVLVKASVEVAGSSLIGIKKAETDQVGYYRFANLPPGAYTLSVRAVGFRAYKQ